MSSPAIIQISAAAVIPPEQLMRRLEQLRDLPDKITSRVAVQLRDPELDTGELLSLGRRLRQITRDVGCRLIVNDRLDLALVLEADGVHLGRRSVATADARRLLGSDIWLSRSCHSPDEIDAASIDGIDALLLSPIFASPGKSQALGPGAVERARRRLPPARQVAVIALGGIDEEGARACFEAGADGVATIRADLLTPLSNGALSLP